MKSRHLGAVTSAVFHSVAAIEAETWAIAHHGPGHQFGSNHNDPAHLQALSPHLAALDQMNALERANRILELLGRERLRQGVQPYQDASLLVRLRNELIHYKSRWNHEMTTNRLQRALQNKQFPVPSFRGGAGVVFPHQILGAHCALWAQSTANVFLAELYAALGGRRPRWLIVAKARRRKRAA